MSEETPDVPEWPREGEPERDGIGEEDNPVPLWFNVGFYGLISFGELYTIYYTTSAWSSLGQYEAQLAAAREQEAAARASLPQTNPYRGDAAAIAEGAEVFATVCAACHLPDGRGLVGPSLVDPYWKYGDDDANLYASVAEGRPLGMPPWGPQLGGEKIWKVLAFMETLPKSSEPGVGAPDHAAAAVPAPGPTGS